MMMLYRLLFQVARLPVAIIAGVPVIVLLSLHGHHDAVQIALFTLPIVFTTMAGFILNDLFDRSDDVGRGSTKPVAAGTVSVTASTVALAALLVFAIAAAVDYAVARSAYVICFTIAGIAAYSPLARMVPYSKGLVTALLCCAPFLYASELIGLDFRREYYVLLVTFILGREMLLDVRDVHWDQIAKIKTAVSVLGIDTSRTLGWLAMTSSLVAFVLLSSGWAQVAFAAGLLSCISAALIYRGDEDSGIAASRVTLLFATIAAALTV